MSFEQKKRNKYPKATRAKTKRPKRKKRRAFRPCKKQKQKYAWYSKTSFRRCTPSPAVRDNVLGVHEATGLYRRRRAPRYFKPKRPRRIRHPLFIAAYTLVGDNFRGASRSDGFLSLPGPVCDDKKKPQRVPYDFVKCTYYHNERARRVPRQRCTTFFLKFPQFRSLKTSLKAKPVFLGEKAKIATG